MPGASAGEEYRRARVRRHGHKFDLCRSCAKSKHMERTIKRDKALYYVMRKLLTHTVFDQMSCLFGGFI